MYNYHTHTSRCGHAIGEDEEYVIEAINASYKGIGFSDHVMLPGLKQSYIRALYEKKEEYYCSIKSLKEKYKDKIVIYTAFECEWDNYYQKYYKKLLDEHEVDYLIFGNHTCYFKGKEERYLKFISPKRYLYRYLETSLKAIRSGLFKIMAHPDLFMSKVKWNKDCEKISKLICKEAKKYNVVLELNCGCFINEKPKEMFGEIRYRYPYNKFWEIAKKEGNTIVVGIDAHAPSAFTSKNIEIMKKFIKDLDLKVTEKLDI